MLNCTWYRNAKICLRSRGSNKGVFPLKFLIKFLIQLIYPRYFRYSIHHLEIVITLTKHYGLITNPSSEMLSVVVILTHRGRDNHSCIDLSVYRFNVRHPIHPCYYKTWKWNQVQSGRSSKWSCESEWFSKCPRERRRSLNWPRESPTLKWSIHEWTVLSQTGRSLWYTKTV